MFAPVLLIATLSAPDPRALVQRALEALRNGSAARAASVRVAGVEHIWVLGNERSRISSIGSTVLRCARYASDRVSR